MPEISESNRVVIQRFINEIQQEKNKHPILVGLTLSNGLSAALKFIERQGLTMESACNFCNAVVSHRRGLWAVMRSFGIESMHHLKTSILMMSVHIYAESGVMSVETKDAQLIAFLSSDYPLAIVYEILKGAGFSAHDIFEKFFVPYSHPERINGMNPAYNQIYAFKQLCEYGADKDVNIKSILSNSDAYRLSMSIVRIEQMKKVAKEQSLTLLDSYFTKALYHPNSNALTHIMVALFNKACIDDQNAESCQSQLLNLSIEDLNLAWDCIREMQSKNGLTSTSYLGLLQAISNNKWTNFARNSCISIVMTSNSSVDDVSFLKQLQVLFVKSPKREQSREYSPLSPVNRANKPQENNSNLNGSLFSDNNVVVDVKRPANHEHQDCIRERAELKTTITTNNFRLSQ